MFMELMLQVGEVVEWRCAAFGSQWRCIGGGMAIGAYCIGGERDEICEFAKKYFAASRHLRVKNFL